MGRYIIVTHVGTSVLRCVNNELLPFVDRVQQLHKEDKVVLAYTSNRGRMKLRQKQVIILSLDEALLEGIRLGVEEIIVLPLHVVGGGDYVQIHEQVALLDRGKQIKALKPLLSTEENCVQLAACIRKSVDMSGINKPILCIGHGVDDESHKWYEVLEERLINEGLECVVDTLCSSKNDLISRLQDKGYEEVHILPLFVVAGYHVTKDLYDKTDSISQYLLSKGIGVTEHYEGIISDKNIASLYISKLS